MTAINGTTGQEATPATSKTTQEMTGRELRQRAADIVALLESRNANGEPMHTVEEVAQAYGMDPVQIYNIYSAFQRKMMRKEMKGIFNDLSTRAKMALWRNKITKIEQLGAVDREMILKTYQAGPDTWYEINDWLKHHRKTIERRAGKVATMTPPEAARHTPVMPKLLKEPTTMVKTADIHPKAPAMPLPFKAEPPASAPVNFCPGCGRDLRQH